MEGSVKKALLVIVMLMVLVGCKNEPRLKNVCTCTQKERVVAWVGEHIKDANNMSDEEMEDVIRELERVAVRGLCGRRVMWCKNGTYIVDW